MISTNVDHNSGRSEGVDAPLIARRVSRLVSRPEPDDAGEPERPERPPASAVLSALSVPKHARHGAIVGVLLAVGAYLVRVLELLGPAAGGREYPVLGPEAWFLVLAFVLAVTAAMLVTILLTAVEAVRMARQVE